MHRLKWLLLVALLVASSVVLAVPAVSANHNPYHPDCSDSLDNDGDGLINGADPGCHTDGDPNNPSSYDPKDQDETDEKVKCNSGRGNGSEINPATGQDCDPGNSGGHNNGGD